MKSVELTLERSLKSKIEHEIIELTDKWIEDNRQMSAEKAINYWSTSPQMRFVENGHQFTNRQHVFETLSNYYSRTTSMDIKWLNREVIPLCSDAALLTGVFQFKLTFKNDEVFEGINAFTGVYLLENDKWALIQGHESTKEE